MAFTVSYTYKAIDKFTAPLAKMAKEVDRMTARMGTAMNRVTASMMGVDKAAARARGSVANLGKVNGQLQGMALNAERYAAAMRKVGSIKIPTVPPGGVGVRPGRGGRRGMDAVDGLVAGGSALGITAGIVATARASMELESSLVSVKRLADLNPAGLAKFDEMTNSLSRSLAMSRTELNEMAASAISAGTPMDDVGKFLALAGKVAPGAKFGSAQQAGEALGMIQTQLRKNINEMEALADQVSHLDDSINTTSQKLYDILGRTAGGIAGWSTQSQTAMAGFFSELEPRAEVAATAMSAVIAKLKVMGGPVSEMMQKDGVAGLKLYFDALKRIKDPIKINQRLIKDFGQQHYDVTSKMLEQIDRLDHIASLTSSQGAVGAVDREHAMLMDSMEGSMKRLTATWENFKATFFNSAFGKGVLDNIEKIVAGVGDLVSKHPQLMQLATIVGVVAAAALALAGAIALVNIALAPLAAIGLVVVGTIAAIGAAILAAWVYCEPFREQLNGLAADFGFTEGAASGLFACLGYLFEFIGKMVGTVLATAIFTVRQFLNTLAAVGEVIWAVLSGRWSEIDDVWNARDAKSREMSQQFDQSMTKSWTTWGDGDGQYGGSPSINLVRGGQVVSGPDASPVERAEAARQQVVAAGGVAGQGPGSGGYPIPPSKLDIMVRAEPGTAATVNKSTLPPGSNVRSGR